MVARGLFWTAGAGAAPTVRGSALAGGFGSARACWEIHSARASAIDLLVIVGVCCGGAAAVPCCCRRWRRRRSRRCGARELVVGLVALLPQIPALTFGVAVDAIVPVAARGGRALRRGQATVRGGLGTCVAASAAVSTCARRSVMAARLAPATTPANRAGTNFTERFDILYPRQRTQRNTTLDALNLVGDLGRNEAAISEQMGYNCGQSAASIWAGQGLSPRKTSEKQRLYGCLFGLFRSRPTDGTAARSREEPEPVLAVLPPEGLDARPRPLRIKVTALTVTAMPSGALPPHIPVLGGRFSMQREGIELVGEEDFGKSLIARAKADTRTRRQVDPQPAGTHVGSPIVRHSLQIAHGHAGPALTELVAPARSVAWAWVE